MNAAKNIQRIAKEKLDLNKIRLSAPQKLQNMGVCGIWCRCGNDFGRMVKTNNAGVAGSGIAVTNPVQFAVFMGVLGITTINYLVNYRM